MMCSRAHASYYHKLAYDLTLHLCGILQPSLGQVWHGSNYLKPSRRFVHATGLIPKQQEVFRGKKVGAWLSKMRVKAKRGNLSGERMKLIEDALGADVLKPVDDIEFERKLADVAEYRRLRGRLPAQHGDADHLGSWVNFCRMCAKTGSLSKAHAQRLDTVLGAEWKPEFKNVKVCTHHTTACGILPPSMYHVCKCAHMWTCLNRAWWHFILSSRACVTICTMHSATISASFFKLK